MIGILHAYSRRNAGDGLLVDLTVERLRRAGFSDDDLLLVSLDPASFPEHQVVAGVGTPSRRVDRRLLTAATAGALLLGSAASRRPVGSVADQLSAVSAFVAVGGGYLRTPDVRASVGVAVNHLPQLALAARSDLPTVYLPQSVGPLRGPVGRLVRRHLGALDRIWLRDGWSLDELRDAPGAERCPDLAILELADPPKPARPRSPGSVLVARDLDHVPGMAGRMRAVADALPGPVVWAVQAAGDESKSDATFYRSAGVPSARPLGEVLRDRGPAVVVSVRLHGAIMSILAGVPAIHLAYDRKGPAAYADLGLERYCFDVRSADPAAVAAAAAAVVTDPKPFWESVEAQRGALRQASRRVDAELARLLP